MKQMNSRNRQYGFFPVSVGLVLAALFSTIATNDYMNEHSQQDETAKQAIVKTADAVSQSD